ncbi:unnamed protein product [Boreogadus saida]
MTGAGRQTVGRLDTHVRDCKARWKGLRDSLVKNRKKMNLPSGSGATSHRDWKYANIMPVMPNRRTIGNLEASEPGQNTQEEEAQEQQEDAARPPRTGRMAAQRGTASSSRHGSRSPNFITVPPPTVPTTASEFFLLSLVPQLDRLNARNQTKAKIAFLQILDDLENSSP